MSLPGLKMRRVGFLGVLGGTALVAACDTTVSFRPNELLWGFITVAAQQDQASQLRTTPNAVFFRGEVSTLPSSSQRPDSCFPAQNYNPPSNSFAGVTYLDAGPTVSVSMGGRSDDLVRQSASGVTAYNLASGTIPYRPGDSAIVRVPGVAGGYPAVEVRAKTAEAFTLQNPVAPAAGALPLRWTAATDTNSSMIVQLIWTPSGSSQPREVRCAFRDDGIDSIPRTSFALWADPGNTRQEIIAIRLRTLLRNISGGAVQFTSTFQVPTPRQ